MKNFRKFIQIKRKAKYIINEFILTQIINLINCCKELQLGIVLVVVVLRIPLVVVHIVVVVGHRIPLVVVRIVVMVDLRILLHCYRLQQQFVVLHIPLVMVIEHHRIQQRRSR